MIKRYSIPLVLLSVLFLILLGPLVSADADSQTTAPTTTQTVIRVGIYENPDRKSVV
jgi:hypothetical protein